MPQTPRTAVFLDLDGTLWEAAVVPASALEAIRAAQANGHKILTNTGRARSEVTDLTYLGLDGFCFAAGAEVILDGETVVHEPIGAEAAPTSDPAAIRAAERPMPQARPTPSSPCNRHTKCPRKPGLVSSSCSTMALT